MGSAANEVLVFFKKCIILLILHLHSGANDVVWKFIAPGTGNYSFEVTNGAQSGDDVCVASSCGGGNSISGENYDNYVEATLSSGQTVYVGLDNDGNAALGHQVTLLVNRISGCLNPPQAFLNVPTKSTVQYMSEPFACNSIGR